MRYRIVHPRTNASIKGLSAQQPFEAIVRLETMQRIRTTVSRLKGKTVPHFCICSVDGDPPDRYWVLADSEAHARRLISLNVEDAARASDIEKFECHIDKSYQPPYGWIYRPNGKNVSIVDR